MNEWIQQEVGDDQRGNLMHFMMTISFFFLSELVPTGRHGTALKVWNRPPVDIKSTRVTQLFKKQLKNFLFRAAHHVHSVSC